MPLPPDQETKFTGKVLYGGGWKPEPYEPREKSWVNASPHAKISHYTVVRNDENALSFQIETRVVGKDYSMAWFVDTKELELVDVSIQDGSIVLIKSGETTGAYLKLPKSCDPNAAPIVNKEKIGLFVTVPKVGAKAAPGPIDPIVLGHKHPPGYYPASEIMKKDTSHMDTMRVS